MSEDRAGYIAKPWLLIYGQRFKSLLERFEEKIEKTDRCWLWRGAIYGNGYGCIWNGEANEGVSRLAYRLWVGPIPKGLHVLHHCDNPICVRPDHLFLGDDLTNRKDCQAKGRANGAKGENNRHAYYTEEQVRFIRSSFLPAPSLVRLFGGHRNYIYAIRKNRTWTHLK